MVYAIYAMRICASLKAWQTLTYCPPPCAYSQA